MNVQDAKNDRTKLWLQGITEPIGCFTLFFIEDLIYEIITETINRYAKEKFLNCGYVLMRLEQVD